MEFFLRTVIVLFIAALCSCGQSDKSGAQKLKFPVLKGAINDYGNIFSDQEEKVLDSLIRKFESRSSIEVKVVSLDSSATTVENFNSYILRLANAWGVGKKSGKDDGILIGISPSFQRVRITNGLGIEKVFTDLDTMRIMDSIMFPEFRKANYFEGTKRGLEELIRILE